MATDIHQTITNQIVAAIEAGTDSFQMPWSCNNGLPIKAASGEYYQGINIVTLWAEAQSKGYSSNLWGGFGYWAKQKGAHVRKGEKSTKIIKFSLVEKENKKTGEIDQFPKTRILSVFNRDQIDGLPEIEEEVTTSEPLSTEYGDRVLMLAENIGADVEFRGNSAHYTPSRDSITMPERNLFIEREISSADVGFASTLCHELTHWTGHKSRLDRGLQVSNNALYSFEELVAELGSSFLCAELGFNYTGVADHASYIASWLKALNNDNTMIFKAATKATKAVQFIMEKESQKGAVA